MERKSLSDILHGDDRNRLAKAWASTEAAKDFSPLPSGDYLAHVTGLAGETSRSRATPGFKIEFTIIADEHAGRKLWHDVWLTEAALPMTKRDLAKLGITSLDQLDRPLPRGIRCKVRVTVRTDDDGTQFNKVKSFDVIGIDVPEADPFAPAPLPGNNGQSPTSEPPVATAAGEVATNDVSEDESEISF